MSFAWFDTLICGLAFLLLWLAVAGSANCFFQRIPLLDVLGKVAQSQYGINR